MRRSGLVAALIAIVPLMSGCEEEVPRVETTAVPSSVDARSSWARTAGTAGMFNHRGGVDITTGERPARGRLQLRLNDPTPTFACCGTLSLLRITNGDAYLIRRSG